MQNCNRPSTKPPRSSGGSALHVNSSGASFEIAGEIFPVRHLSGDFFKVMELDSASLGLVRG